MEYNDIILYKENYDNIINKFNNINNIKDINQYPIHYNDDKYKYNIININNIEYNIFFDFIHLTKIYKNKNLDNNKDKLNNLINSLSLIVCNIYKKKEKKLKLNDILFYINNDFNKIRFLNLLIILYNNNNKKLFNDLFKFILNNNLSNLKIIKELYFDINKDEEIINLFNNDNFEIKNLSENDKLKYINNTLFYIYYYLKLNKTTSTSSSNANINNYIDILKSYLIIIYNNDKITELIEKIDNNDNNKILFYTNILFYFDDINT